MNLHRLFLVGLCLASVAVTAAAWRRWIAGPAGRAGVRDLGDTGAAGPGGVETPIWLVAALMVLLAQVIGASMGGTLAGISPDAPPTLRQQAIMQLASSGAAVLTGFLVVTMIRARAPKGAGLRIQAGDVPRALLWLAAMGPVYLLCSEIAVMISHLVSEVPSGAIKHETLTTLQAQPASPWAWGMIAAAVVGAPIAEEFAYRLGVQSFFLRVTNGAWRGWAAILLTSACFAPMHLGAVPPSGIPSLFLLSMTLGLAYERTRRLGVPMVMHAAFNAINVAAVMLGWVG